MFLIVFHGGGVSGVGYWDCGAHLDNERLAESLVCGASYMHEQRTDFTRLPAYPAFPIPFPFPDSKD